MNKKVLAVLGVGCLGVVSIAIIVFSLFLWWVLQETPKLNSSTTMPSSVSLDSTFTIVVDLTNPHKESVYLDCIDISDSFLEGVQVVSVEPKEKETTRFFGSRTWVFERNVKPGTKTKVTFTMKAVQQGHFNGDLDVCNTNQNSTSHIVDVVVKKP